jgi:hypothetical protein
MTRISIVCMTLLAASLMIPTGRGFADNDERGDIQTERQDFRQAKQQPEQFKTAT